MASVIRGDDNFDSSTSISKTAGAVGTYVLAHDTTAATYTALGSTRAGSNLYPANTYQDGTGAGYDSAGGTLSGTWRAMGATKKYNGTLTGSLANTMTTLWVRIS